MKVIFKYKKEKDIWCIKNFGPGRSESENFPNSKTYEDILKVKGENPSKKDISDYIDKVLNEDDIDIKELGSSYQKNAEKVFGLKINEEIAAYLTINNRCPYNVDDKLFFVTIDKKILIDL